MIRVLMLLLSLSLLVTLHEMGHFFPARWFKTKVEKFYLFFDFMFPISTLLPYSLLRWVYQSPENRVEFLKNKALVTFHRKGEGETEYGIGYFPLGGYVKIAGMVDESMDVEALAKDPEPWEFRSKPAWQRLIIMIGGVTVNFVLGILIFAMSLWQYGKEYVPNESVKYGIHADSLGQLMGLRNGDKILSIGDKPFTKFNPRLLTRDIVINNAAKIEIERGGQKGFINIDPSFVTTLSSQANKNVMLFTARTPFIIQEVKIGMPAATAGIQKEDQVIGVNEIPTMYFDVFEQVMAAFPDQIVSINVKRGNDTLNFNVKPNAEGKIGVARYGPNKFFEVKRETYGFLESFPAGIRDVGGFIGDQYKAYGQIFSGKIKANESLGGVASMANLFPNEWDWESFWRITGILSLVLAIMNLLPIPGLDGGYVVFLLWEVISGKKPNDKIVEKATTVGLMLLIALMLYANGLDIVRYVFGK